MTAETTETTATITTDNAGRSSNRTGTVESRWIMVGDLRWFTRFSTNPAPNDAPVIVLVHGLAVSSLYMIPLARSLAPNYLVYAPDFPGYGNSERPPYVPLLPELADGLIRWMDVLGIDRPILIGNSFGAQIIVELAVRHPKRISRAVLIGPTLDPSGGVGPRQIGRLLLDAAREPCLLDLVQIWDYLRFGARRLIVTYLDMLHDRMEEKMPHVEAPILVVRGGRDPIVTEPWTERLAMLAPFGTHAVIPGAAHAANFSAPNTLVNIIEPFLSGIPAITKGEPAIR